MSAAQPLFLGLDVGTSGCRAAVINADGQQLDFQSVPLPVSTGDKPCVEQNPNDWWQALTCLIKHKLDATLKAGIRAIAIDGTSASLLLCDEQGEPLTPCLMYNDQRAISEAAVIEAIAPAACGPVRGPSSALAKLLYFNAQHITGVRHALHQADWLSNRLMQRYGISDSNNCLKLGFDPQTGQWPEWLLKLVGNPSLLPRVHKPGTVIGTLDSTVASAFSLATDVSIIAGTTDSVAAALAAGARLPGDAITSLGSTLVVKVVSDTPVASPQYGVYSHPYGDHWLVGGASNSGGAVVLNHFSLKQIETLSSDIDPTRDSGLHYYPLVGSGERFPIADVNKKPQLAPRPDDDRLFLQGLFEGIADIEALAYQRLAELGATPVKRIISTGGGSQNLPWNRIRERKLGRPLHHAISNDAAYGSALLARQGYSSRS